MKTEASVKQRGVFGDACERDIECDFYLQFWCKEGRCVCYTDYNHETKLCRNKAYGDSCRFLFDCSIDIGLRCDGGMCDCLNGFNNATGHCYTKEDIFGKKYSREDRVNKTHRSLDPNGARRHSVVYVERNARSDADVLLMISYALLVTATVLLVGIGYYHMGSKCITFLRRRRRYRSNLSYTTGWRPQGQQPDRAANAYQTRSDSVSVGNPLLGHDTTGPRPFGRWLTSMEYQPPHSLSPSPSYGEGATEERHQWKGFLEKDQFLPQYETVMLSSYCGPHSFPKERHPHPRSPPPTYNEAIRASRTQDKGLPDRMTVEDDDEDESDLE